MEKSHFSLFHICNSFLALLVIILLCGSAFVSLIAAIVPYWFIIDITYRYGVGPKKTYAQNWGLFTYEESWDSVVMLDKSFKLETIPDVMKLAEIFYLLGVLSMVLAGAYSFVLGMYRFVSLTGEMGVAAASTFGSVCLILGSFLASMVLDSSLADYKKFWNQYPLDKNLIITQAQPTAITANWALFVGWISAIVSLGSAVMAWIQACRTRCGIEDIRDRQLSGRNKYRPIQEPHVALRIPPRTIGQYQPGAQGYQPERPDYQPTYDPTMATMYASAPQEVPDRQYYPTAVVSSPQYPPEVYKPVHVGGGSMISDEVAI